jgi:hypothetical protein
MPHQPLARIKPDADYSITADAFEKRPLIAQGIAKCVAKWSEVEVEIGTLFILLLEANEIKGAELYHALGSSKAKRDAIKALALSSLTVDSLRIVEALLRVVKGQQAIRDRIAHWVWFLSDELDDGIIFVDPKLVWQKIGRVRESIRALGRVRNFIRPAGPMFRPKRSECIGLTI